LRVVLSLLEAEEFSGEIHSEFRIGLSKLRMTLL